MTIGHASYLVRTGEKKVLGSGVCRFYEESQILLDCFEQDKIYKALQWNFEEFER